MTPDEMRAEADRLYRQQVKERGTEPWEFNGKKVRVPGPYVPTPEREARAKRIGQLWRDAARLDHPLSRKAD